MPNRDYPLATVEGVEMFAAILAAQDIWYGLTRQQRNALTSTKRYRCHPVTLTSLRAKGLTDDNDNLTDLGRAVVRWRPVKP